MYFMCFRPEGRWRGLLSDRWLAVLFPPINLSFSNQGENDCWMGLQVNCVLLFFFFCDRSLRIINKIYSGENYYSRESIVIQCVNFYKIIPPLCLYFWGHSPTDVATLRVILITEFHWENHTTNGSMLRARQSETFYSPPQPLPG